MVGKNIQYDATPEKSRLFCPLNQNLSELFFSLVDYRNNYFTSDDPDKILEFYNGFENRDQLIQWMKERPKGIANILEVDGDKDIIVVIPTGNFNGKHAKECRDNIFKGLHIIFVESGEVPDPYFNYAHNCNVGIKKAIEYNPKWIVVSNDDMRKIDEPQILKNNLIKFDPDEVDVLFTRKSPDHYHSLPTYFGRPNSMGKILHRLLSIFRKRFFSIAYTKENFTTKFYLNVVLLPKHKVIKLFFNKIKPIIVTESFTILSGVYAKVNRGDILNESFCNGAEDWDLSFRIFYEFKKYDFIDYLIGEYTGSALGVGKNRALRDIANISLFNKIHEKDFK